LRAAKEKFFLILQSPITLCTTIGYHDKETFWFPFHSQLKESTTIIVYKTKQRNTPYGHGRRRWSQTEIDFSGNLHPPALLFGPKPIKSSYAPGVSVPLQ
jgi:hypothetical protein